MKDDNRVANGMSSRKSEKKKKHDTMVHGWVQEKQRRCTNGEI
jgi:hypothetical protein